MIFAIAHIAPTLASDNDDQAQVLGYEAIEHVKKMFQDCTPLMNSKRPVLVTGAHRSGTTWVGRTLAAAPGAAYIHEPFNINQRPGICDLPARKFWYTYVTQEDDLLFSAPLKSTLEFRYAVRSEIRSIRSLRDLGRMARDVVKINWLRLAARPWPLVKDPFAFYSAPWFAEEFKAQVVILVRHPAAFVNSILRQGWDFPFEHWLQQERLMRDRLSPFQAEIKKFAEDPQPLIDQAVLLWNSIYSVANHYRIQHPAWHILRHEDVSMDPGQVFSALYGQLGLTFTSDVKRFIARTTATKTSIAVVDRPVLDIHRHSRANIKAWQTQLTKDEVAYIRNATEGISELFYEDGDWE
jgi:hypothetical protein